MDDGDRALIAAAASLDGGDTIFDALDDYLEGLDLAARRARLDRAWLQAPIAHAEALDAYPSLVDQFDVLQGDVIRTNTAYLLGQRVLGGTYVVVSATCDSVVRPRPRQETLLLLPVVPHTDAGFEGRTPEKRARARDAALELLTTFRTTRALYLPGLPGDGPNVLFRTISFKEIHTMEPRHVPTVERVASMSLVGWRAFNLLVRALVTRTGDEEVGFRLAVDVARATP